MPIKYPFYFAIIFFLTSCSSAKKSTSNDYFVNEADYVKAYKAFVFQGCLNEGSKGSFNEFLKKNNDLGLFSETEMISHSTANFADSLGRVFSHKIEPFDYGDGKGKIPNLSGCYVYALSDEIDSLARKQWRKANEKKYR